jgi:hypothetical protein
MPAAAVLRRNAIDMPTVSHRGGVTLLRWNERDQATFSTRIPLVLNVFSSPLIDFGPTAMRHTLN